MIAFLAGRLAAKSGDGLVLEVNGIGYQLHAGTRTLSTLPAAGEELLLYTFMQVRENEVALYGFADEAEKRAFLTLIEVSGVGPKVALAILSTLTPELLTNAVATEDIALLSSVPGVGKKTAQRLALELAGKLTPLLSPDGAAPKPTGGTAAAPTAANPVAEAQAALFSMGFSAAEIAEALSGADSAADTQALLRHALARLGGV
ncbi:MAG: Holliday junction branch migration protein RuvA [Actinomycetes bacterium]|jgi:Holliday junction DNA helicase RuvA|nr:Holliday junction branch migration protein RuvA [Actinomycetes bacterium]